MIDSSLEAQLRKAGLRVTAQRLAVLAVAEELPHTELEAIVREVRDRLGSVSQQAIYDVLRALTSAGLLRRIQPAGGPARFETRVGDNHHHVVCRECGATGDVDCVLGEAPCLEPSRTQGFVLDEAEVTFWGRCPGCLAKLHLPTPDGFSSVTSPLSLSVPPMEETA